MEEPVIIHTNRFRPSPPWRLAAHRHEEFHELIYVVRGGIETKMRGQVFHGAADDVLFYPRGTVHAERAVGEPTLETIFVQFQWPDTSEWPLLRHDHFGRIGFLARWMTDLTPAARQRYSIQTTLLLAILHEYSSLVSEPELEGINLARQYAKDHLAEPISLQDLADVSRMSRFHFAHTFQRSTGMSPMRYVRHLRLEQARTLLLTTDLPLRTIAVQTGMGDMYQLSRAFKRLTGRSPGALRAGKGGPASRPDGANI